MKILDTARKLEARLSRTFNDAAQGVAKRIVQGGAQTLAPAWALEPLEIVHAIIDSVEDEVQPAGRGSHVFPFNRIRVSVAAPSRHARARLEAVIEATPTLTDRIIDRLRVAGCDPSGVTVKVTYLSQPDVGSTQAFHVDFGRQPAGGVGEPMPLPPPCIELTVLAGTAETSEHSFTLARIDLGRCAEVRDSHHRLIRTNHVAFADSAGGVNDSVSRRHAHIVYSESSGEHRVYDDRSAHGTCVVRNSTTMTVPSASRGIRLQGGDQIVLGEARLGVTITRERG